MRLDFIIHPKVSSIIIIMLISYMYSTILDAGYCGSPMDRLPVAFISGPVNTPSNTKISMMIWGPFQLIPRVYIIMFAIVVLLLFIMDFSVLYLQQSSQLVKRGAISI